jgi:hypothetical protein
MSSENDKGIDALYDRMFTEVDDWGYTKYERSRSKELLDVLINRYGGAESFRDFSRLWYNREVECSDVDYWEWILIMDKVTEYQKKHKVGNFAEENKGVASNEGE